MNIPMSKEDVPTVNTEQMIEVDRAMIDDYRIELIQMMENAGCNLAHLARKRFLNGDPRGKEVVVMAGTGGNGGGALVCARRLHNYGADVHVITTKDDAGFAPVPRHQLDILRRMKIPVTAAGESIPQDETELIIDGLIGYSLQGSPHGTAAHLIRWANAQLISILSLDVPSGLDAADGTIHEPAIRATATMTLALPKTGLLADNAADQVGELYLADISVPRELYASPSLQLHVGSIFAASDIVRLQ